LQELIVESLDQEGRGVARRDGKAVFIEGALPGEIVTCNPYRRKPTYEIATLVTVVKPSAARVTPRCPYFGLCGGCALQHLDVRAQVATKQRVLEDSLWHIGRLRPGSILPPCTARPGATGTAPALLCATCRRRAAHWSGFTSGAAATSRT